MTSLRTPSATDRPLGAQLVDAIAAHDRAALELLFSTPVTFRGLTPRGFWDADTPAGVADIVLGTWFSPSRTVTEVVWVDTCSVADVQRVSYRMAVDHESGPSVIEQVGYYEQQDGTVTHLRLICSGFRPTDAAERQGSRSTVSRAGSGTEASSDRALSSTLPPRGSGPEAR